MSADESGRRGACGWKSWLSHSGIELCKNDLVIAFSVLKSLAVQSRLLVAANAVACSAHALPPMFFPQVVRNAGDADSESEDGDEPVILARDRGLRVGNRIRPLDALQFWSDAENLALPISGADSKQSAGADRDQNGRREMEA